jgi:hypothetical protein
MKNAVIAAVVAALVASGSTYAGTRLSLGNSTVVKHSALVSVASGDRGWASADCPQGSVATGGGLLSSDLGTGGALLTDSAPSPISTHRFPIGWSVAVQNPSDTSVQIQAYAVCVK